MSRAKCWAVVFLGIVVGQFLIYGPSLVGRKILLPLDYLALPEVYLPRTAEVAKIVPHDATLSDLVLQFETDRRFAAGEMRAGRFPFWAPYQYCGAPFVWPKYSPFLLLQTLTASPVIVAWAQLAAALVAGLGAYAFCRRALGVGFWAAAIPAWCYPLTGFFVFWQGFPTCAAAYWLPWLLLAVDEAVRRTRPLALSVATLLVLVSGHLDVAGQVLLISGLYAMWCWFDAPRKRSALLALILGWSLGFLLAAPHLLPMLDYARTGARMVKRSAGAMDRPPGDLSALPQAVLPDIHGTTRAGSIRLGHGNQIESSAAAYAGIVATLFAVPLAWCDRRRRSANLFWSALAIFGLGWCLGLPGLVQALQWPGLNMMSHNRLVIATSIAIVAMSALGLDALFRGQCARRRCFLAPAALLAGLCAWCLWRAVAMHGRLAGFPTERSWFTQSLAASALLCAAGLALWCCVWRGWTIRPWMLGAVFAADLLWFARDRSAQCDPQLYYPRLPVLEEIAKSNPGRVLGYSCLPAQLLQTHGLDDVRGYDSIDPARIVALVMLAASPDTPRVPYAQTQWLVPGGKMLPPDGIQLSPILDMLGVTHVVFRGEAAPSMRPALQSPDYWALVNRSALPRVFVPRRVETVADDRERLARLSAPDFDAREIAFVESPTPLALTARGGATIVQKTPLRVTIAVAMETPGVVVLAESWDAGWQAYLDGKPVPIVRTNHALRGAVVPAGNATLEFRYEPESVALGFRLAGGAALALAGWLLLAKKHSPPTPA